MVEKGKNTTALILLHLKDISQATVLPFLMLFMSVEEDERSLWPDTKACTLLATCVTGTTVLSDMNMKYDVIAAALPSHCATVVVQLQDCVWSLAMPHSVLALKHSAVMALLRTAIRFLIVGIDYWLPLLLDIWSVPQENVNNLKRKFHHCCTVIKARLVVTVRQLPVRQWEWEPTHCESLPPPPVLSAHLRHGQAQLQSALAS